MLKREIIKSEEGKKVCEVEIDVFNIYSPNLKDAELIVKVNLTKLTVLFHPQTVNSIIKFFRNIKYGDTATDLEGLHLQMMKEIEFSKPIEFLDGQHKDSEQHAVKKQKLAKQ